MSVTPLATVAARISALGAATKTIGVAVALVTAGALGAVAAHAAPAVPADLEAVVVTPSVLPAATAGATVTPTSPAAPVTSPADVPALTPEPTIEPDPEPTARPVAPALPESAWFGQRVAEDARDGGVEGPVISQDAQERAAARADERTAARAQSANPAPAPGSRGHRSHP